jgi:phosphate-selective porin OprO/OprP
MSARYWLKVCIFFVAAGSPVAAEDPPAPPSESPSFTDLLTAQPKFKLRGRIEADAVFPGQSAASRAQIGDLQGGFGFRRARIGAEGEIDTSARWVAEIDFAGGTVKLKDTFIGLTAVPLLREFRVGYFREPFSLDGATSSRFITFLERSPVNELDPARNWGVMGIWLSDDDRVTAQLGAFRDGTSSGGMSVGTGNAWALTGRLTGRPIYETDDVAFRVLHVGAAVSLRQPADGIVSYETSPQSNLLSLADSPPSPLLPSVSIPAKSQQLYNVQVAAVNGPWTVQAEWMGSAIQQASSGVVFFHGAYVAGSYFVTGEHRDYNPVTAAFDAVSVRKPVVKTAGSVQGTGAVELVARFSFFSTRSDDIPPQPTGQTFKTVTGGMLYESTIGTNWYLNDYTRLMADYTVGVPTLAGQPALPVHSVSLRTAIYW